MYWRLTRLDFPAAMTLPPDLYDGLDPTPAASVLAYTDSCTNALDLDYATFGEGDKDDLELYLRTLINRTWGVEFATTNINIDFPRLGEYELCAIEVKRGMQPLYLEVQDRHGRKSEKFYVRSGNSSQPFENPSEIASYVAKRFTQALATPPSRLQNPSEIASYVAKRFTQASG